MAIGFGRVEFIKRSEGRNACQLSAYLSRSRILFEGNCCLEPKLYDFSHREVVSHHEVIIPDGADENLKVPEVLWNLAERKEVRKDAQVSMHLVLALPDDKEITLEDRIELTRSFIKKHYHGLIAECVVHPPERTIEFTEDNEALGIPKGTVGSVMQEKEGNYIVSLPKGFRANPFIEIGTKYEGMSVQEHNWHAHAQLTTRRLKENGYELEDRKATDLMPVIRKGKVVSGPDVGKLWAQHQNEYFLSKGLTLRVDENGLVPQEHLGPVRMRGRAFALLEEHEKRLELNELAASNPQNILKGMTKRQSVFTKDDVERFMLKHVPGDKIQEVREGFWKLEELVQLRSIESKKLLSKFTSKEVIKEEKRILRLADRIYSRSKKPMKRPLQDKFAEGLSKEQKTAYRNILEGRGLSCIQGYAGTGKSYLLKALKDAYEEKGLIVRAFGPDNATANVLKEKGLVNAENIYRFLYSEKYGHRSIHKGFEVWVLDEAGKLGNKPLLEFLKLAERKGAKVILAGDSKQLPPVERGGVFKTFCQRYETEGLKDIQRQKKESARMMAINLAKGEIGEALDKLSNDRAIIWSLTRKEAIESLVLKWANDHRAQEGVQQLGKDSSLIIAETNAELRVLNEMVRLVRKERGEIDQKEFECQTAHGKIFVSAGDRIEFRKNDRELRVSNGTYGVLLKAEKNRFSVAIQEGDKKTRMVSFNPQEYHSFQLGYGLTCTRAQSSTVQKAYVLHSPRLNQQMAYVGLTRQIQEVHYFISKEDVSSLSDLKKQALRDGSKETTLEYTHTGELEEAIKQKEREGLLQELKRSDSTTKRLKGSALSLWDRIHEKTFAYLGKREDRRPDQEFFNYREQRESSDKMSVREVSKEELKELTVVPTETAGKIQTEKVVEKVIEQDRTIDKYKETVKMRESEIENEKALYDAEENSSYPSKSIEKSAFSWKDLPKQEKSLLSSYFNAASKASELKGVVQAESSANLEKTSQSPHYQEWQKACALRNESAYQLRPHLSKEKRQGVLNQKSLYYIETHAKKHEEVLKIQEQKALQASKIKGLDDQLASHVEPLLYRLFPDGPSSKTTQSYRFGAKGSLTVSHSGSKAGQFYDFERQEGGGLLQLIARELKLDKQEARTWAGEFLGTAHEIKTPLTFKRPKEVVQERSGWTSLTPDPKVPAPSFEALGKLHHYYKEVARHPYHDLQGNLLYYVLRLEDGSGNKITPPLSYGKFEDGKPSWQLKGFSPECEKRPLYNLHHLKENPKAEVLIVEGEKTADKALEKFPESPFICLTWSGGAGSVSKTDWSPLHGRKVKIWPDNDPAGFKAAAEITDELKKVGAYEIKLPNRGNLFEKLPAKWDLADPLPEGVTLSSLHSTYPYRNENHFQASIMRELSLKNELSLLEKTKTLDLLYAYEKTHADRLKGEFPEEISSNQRAQIQQKQLREGLRFLKKENEISKEILRNPDINASGQLAERLSHQIHLHEARTGSVPTLAETLTLKETLEDFPYEKIKCPGEIKESVIHRALSQSCTNALGGRPIDDPYIEKVIQTSQVELAQQQELKTSQEQALEKQRSHEKDLSKGLYL